MWAEARDLRAKQSVEKEGEGEEEEEGRGRGGEGKKQKVGRGGEKEGGGRRGKLGHQLVQGRQQKREWLSTSQEALVITYCSCVRHSIHSANTTEYYCEPGLFLELESKVST